MKNDKFGAHTIKNICANKLGISFRSRGEINGWFIHKNKKTCRITIPQGRNNVPKGTYRSMANQLKLSVSQFDSLLECPLKLEDYKKIIDDKI